MQIAQILFLAKPQMVAKFEVEISKMRLTELMP
jgi:hypothetical protein